MGYGLAAALPPPVAFQVRSGHEGIDTDSLFLLRREEKQALLALAVFPPHKSGRRGAEPQSDEGGLSACSMERAAPRRPLVHCLG